MKNERHKKTTSAAQDLPNMQQAIYLAQKMGKELGGRKIL